MDPLSEDAAVLAMRLREIKGLRAKVDELRAENVKLESEKNGLWLQLRQLTLQHQQDEKDLAILRAQYDRVANRNTMVEGALNTAHRRLTPHGGFAAVSEYEDTTPEHEIPRR